MPKNTSLWALFLLAPLSHAAQNPIQAQVLASLPANVYVNVLGQYQASYKFTNNIPFKLAKPLQILKSSNSSTEFQFIDNCSGKRLDSKESCLVNVNLNPTFAGLKSFSLTEVYGYDEVPLPSQNATATGGSGQALIIGATPTPLTQPLVLNTASPWEFTFTNTSQTAATGVSIAVSGTNSYVTNCGLNLQPTDHCYVKGSYTPTQPGLATISAGFSYTQGSTVTETTSSSTGSTGEGALVCQAGLRYILMQPQMFFRRQPMQIIIV